MTSPTVGPEVPVPSTKDKKPSSSKTTKAKTRKPEQQRDDVDQLCQRLADRLYENGRPRPRISEEWKTSARLLLDDKTRAQPVTLDKALALVDWCQKDDFWKGNVKSMPKFREKYDDLRLRALAEWNASNQRLGQQRTARFTLPPSNAPARLADDERCPEHPSFPTTNCGMCRADRMGDPA